MEAADLGVRLCQRAARSVYRCYLAVALPAVALSMATLEIAAWLPPLVIWWLKPWFDRTILFVLSRAAFGQETTLSDLWQAQRSVLWGQLLSTLTWRRLSPWRAFTQPVYQLEGHPFGNARKRVSQLRRMQTTQALLVTSAYSAAETMLSVAVVSLAFWLAPAGTEIPFADLIEDRATGAMALLLPLAYAAVVLFLEPFYSAAGFAMYLNRRAELEAWDIEQELRRAFGQ